jgi:hypothetical protein
VHVVRQFSDVQGRHAVNVGGVGKSLQRARDSGAPVGLLRLSQQDRRDPSNVVPVSPRDAMVAGTSAARHIDRYGLLLLGSFERHRGSCQRTMT